jgi:hypothetical protein
MSRHRAATSHRGSSPGVLIVAALVVQLREKAEREIHNEDDALRGRQRSELITQP